MVSLSNHEGARRYFCTSHCLMRALGTSHAAGPSTSFPVRRNKAAGAVVEHRRATTVEGMDEAELACLLRAALRGDEKAYSAFLTGAAALVRAIVRRRVGQG